MKHFLLTAGDQYYPSRGSGDWIGTFATREEAEAMVKNISHELGWSEYRITGRHSTYEWYEIIDLRNWM